MIFCYQTAAGVSHIETEDTTAIKINISKKDKFQTIAHFGASDAWSCQFVGLWPEQKRRAIASLLFSKDFDEEGNPKGIGLSIWRFNIGAGSAEQGDQSGIKDEWRRAESFLNPDGSYNWEKQAGQVWFAQVAQEFGVEYLLAFPNSPPVKMTRNGRAYAENGRSNLSAQNFDDYANYLGEVIHGLQEKGLKVDYISPVNEPQWDWSDGGQEGSPFWNSEIAGIVRELDRTLSAKTLNTKIDIAEAGKINYLYEAADKPGRGQQVAFFFDPESDNYIGNLSHVGKVISAHSYFTTSPDSAAAQMRDTLNSKIQSIDGLEYWMSEYCILGGNAGEIDGNGRDLGMESALYMAKVIHSDLTIANATAWHWWLAVSPYDYKDGLVYIDKNKENGAFYESKMLWTLGNYSRFIRPGYERVGVNLEGMEVESADLLVSAYQSTDDKKLVYVIINSASVPVNAQISNEGKEVANFKSYITSEEHNLSPVELGKGGNDIIIPARSVLTIVSGE